MCVRLEVSWLLNLFCEKVVSCWKRVDCQALTCMKEGRKVRR